MPLDFCYACAVTCALAGAVAVAVALLVSFDCLLRISEVAALKVGDVVDHRAQADPVGRGVAVYLRSTKTGRRQAVMIEDAAVAELLVQWQAAVARSWTRPAVCSRRPRSCEARYTALCERLMMAPGKRAVCGSCGIL